MKDFSSKRIGIIVACLLIFASVWRLPLVTNPRLAFQMFFEITVFGLFGVLLWHANKWFALFFILAFISSVYPNGDPVSWVAFRSVFYGLLWYLLIVHFVNTRGIQPIIDAMCIIALANVLLLITQELGLCMKTIGFDLIYTPLSGKGTRPVGLMANRNEVSCLLAFCLPAFFSRKRWKYFLPAIILGLFLAKSTGGILASTVGILFYLCMRGRIVWGLCFVISAIFLHWLFMDFPSSSGRWEPWKKGWKLYKQHWVFGLGLGHWKVVFSKVKILGLFYKTAHNEIVQAVFEMGIGFAVIAAGYALSIIRRFRKDALIPTMALIIILINSLVHFGFHIATTMMIGVTWMAIFEVTLRDAGNNL